MTHTFEMRVEQFSRYLFNLDQKIIVEKDDEIQINDVIILKEIDYPTNKRTGRFLAVKISNIDSVSIKVKDENLLYLEIEKLTNYDEVYKDLSKDDLKVV